jgi:leader peptidase (prepilin peptidase)/N-methyltransferase
MSARERIRLCRRDVDLREEHRLPEVPQMLYLALLGVLGLVFGSFGNVVIWRLPRGESLSSPPSRCPKCGAQLQWRDNVPVLSWLSLRGRCRSCDAVISARYPVVEVASAALFVLAGLLYGLEWQALVAIFFFYVLLLLTMIDIDTMRLPNTLVIVLAGGGSVAALLGQLLGISLAPLLELESGLLAEPLVAAAVGALIGVGISLGIALLYQLARGRQGLGMGDVKLLGVMGIFLGPYVLMAFFLGALVGAVWGVASSLRASEGARHKIPFGPFLSLGAVLTIVAGVPLWDWYLSVLSVT